MQHLQDELLAFKARFRFVEGFLSGFSGSMNEEPGSETNCTAEYE